MIDNLIDSIESNKLNSAGDQFEQILKDKITSAIDQKRIQVASSMFKSEEPGTE
jgi:hypothetical protein